MTMLANTTKPCHKIMAMCHKPLAWKQRIEVCALSVAILTMEILKDQPLVHSNRVLAWARALS